MTPEQIVTLAYEDKRDFTAWLVTEETAEEAIAELPQEVADQPIKKYY